MAASRMLLNRDIAAKRHPRAAFVEEFVARNGVALMNAARRYSASAADADDAYQRTLEVLLTKAPDGDEQRLLAWSLTVVKNEAMMEHRRAARIADQSYETYSAEFAADVDDADDRIADIERFAQGREALKRIKPDQLRCLLLRADGLDYDEIIDQTGFSYAKVNRCLSEGRKAFRERLARLDSGAECRRLEGVLSMIADGEAKPQARVDAELHLRNCGYCQATLRENMAAADRAAALLPVGFISAASLAESAQQAGGTIADAWRRVTDAFDSAYANLQERLAHHLSGLQIGGETAAAKKVGLVLAISASVVAGGVTAERAIHNDGGAPPAEASKPLAGLPMAATPLNTDPRESLAVKARARKARAKTRAKARVANESDVLGKHAGTSAGDSAAPIGGTEQQSANDPDAFDVPVAGSPATPEPGGSNNDLPELAP